LDKRVGVVVPAYNASAHIADVLSGMPEIVDVIAFVNDGSLDDTWERASAVEREGLVCLRHARRRGVGAAMESGYRECLLQGCDLIAVMAGDGQMSPDDLEALLVPVASGEADYAKGNRFLRADCISEMPLGRRFGNVTLSLLSKPVTGYWRVFDSQCGYTVISRYMLGEILKEGIYHGYGVPNDLLTRLGLLGARVKDVPVKAIYSDGHSRMNMRVVPFTVSALLFRLWLKRMGRTALDMAVMQER